ncbi:hypothetical protein AHAS_Ahas16G0121200 [Arachis hypogaea]
MVPEDISSYSFTRTIWKGLVPIRVELFVWFVLTGRVSTKERLSQFGVIHQEEILCVLCNNGVEGGYHLFLGCSFSWQVWVCLVIICWCAMDLSGYNKGTLPKLD